MRVVFLDRDSVQAEVCRPVCADDWVEWPNSAPGEVAGRLAGASVAISNKVGFDAALLDRLPDLRLIAVAATGTNHIDLAACRARGIVVSNIRDYARHAVPEHVFCLILALRRQLLAYRADLRAGAWQRSPVFCHFGAPIHDLHGSTLGIVGHGVLGQAVARLGEAFGMRVLLAERRGAAPRAGRLPFERVLRQSDVLSLHCPLTTETAGLIGAAELAAMRPGALLINAARGGLVDEAALLDALQRGVIAGAGLDVLAQEPPAADTPLLAADLPNLLVTPHVAWSSREAMQALADQLIDNIEAWAAGAPRNRVV